MSKRTEENFMRVIAYVAAHEHTKSAPIARALGLEKSSVCTFLLRGVREGKLQRSGTRGCYTYSLV